MVRICTGVRGLTGMYALIRFSILMRGSSLMRLVSRVLEGSCMVTPNKTPKVAALRWTLRSAQRLLALALGVLRLE